MKKLISFLCVALIFLSLSVYSQKGNETHDSDSLNSLILSNFNKKIAEIEKQRKVDSIKKATLETKILSLANSDSNKKESLFNQIRKLQSKDSIRLADKKKQIDALRKTAKSYPVTGLFVEDTLFFIYNRLGSFSAKDRAEAISNRIKSLSENYNFKKENLKISKAETTIDLIYKETIIVSITENDALWNNTSKIELAKKYQKIISDEILKYKSATSLSTLLKQIGLASLVILLIVVLIKLIRRLFDWTSQKISSQKGKLFKGITLRNYTLFDENREERLLLAVNTVLKWLFIILTVYITLPVLFSIFPWTKYIADILIGYITTPAKAILWEIWDYLPKLITVIIIVVLFQYVLKGLLFLKNEIETENLSLNGFYPDWAAPTYQIVRVIIYSFMFVVIFPYLPGSESPVFKGVSVFLGVLFTFGSSGPLSNIIAGVVLTYMRLFKIGDRVKIGDLVGDVIEKSMLVTRIRTPKNEIISVPNSTVMSSHTINYSSDTVDKGLILHTTVTIGYDVPWKEMHKALLNAADRTEFCLKEPKPFVLQTSLDDFYVSYQINAYTKEANKQASIYSQLHANIQDCCNEAGIEILSPHYRSARDGNATTIPSDYLSKDYKAPPFNVNIQDNNNEKQ